MAKKTQSGFIKGLLLTTVCYSVATGVVGFVFTFRIMPPGSIILTGVISALLSTFTLFSVLKKEKSIKTFIASLISSLLLTYVLYGVIFYGFIFILFSIICHKPLFFGGGC